MDLFDLDGGPAEALDVLRVGGGDVGVHPAERRLLVEVLAAVCNIRLRNEGSASSIENPDLQKRREHGRCACSRAKDSPSGSSRRELERRKLHGRIRRCKCDLRDTCCQPFLRWGLCTCRKARCRRALRNESAIVKVTEGGAESTHGRGSRQSLRLNVVL